MRPSCSIQHPRYPLVLLAKVLSLPWATIGPLASWADAWRLALILLVYVWHQPRCDFRKKGVQFSWKFSPSYQRSRTCHAIFCFSANSHNVKPMKKCSWTVWFLRALRVHYWVIQTYVYHCSPVCRSQRGDWDSHIHRNDLAPLPQPASNKHITAWTTDSWPVSLNTSNTCMHHTIN